MAGWAAPAFRTGAAVAKVLPAPVANGIARVIGLGIARVPSDRRRIVERNLQRVRPGLAGADLRRAVDHTFESYARYWVDSFRLPSVGVDELDAGFSAEGLEHIEAALEAGGGCILGLPHLGSWEWAGFWLTRVRGWKVTVVVEQLEPPEAFEWFADLRRGFGFEVIPLGPSAATECVRALRANRIVCLLSDRDIAGGGVEVDFFGERTTLPGGPAVLALRTRAPLIPTAVYHRDGKVHGDVRPPLPVVKSGKLRQDVARVTQALATALEDLIRQAPEQWHLMQPNWPSDR